jgi:hypothetical protein
LVTGHEVSTAYELGWASLKNGALLKRAAERFDVFVTVDQNVQFQQNLASLPLPVIVLVAPDNRFATLAPYASKLLELLLQPLARELIRVESTQSVVRVPARPRRP